MFIVVYDDGGAISAPMGWSRVCPGTLESWAPGGKVAVFLSRQQARAAIRRSSLVAEERALQGLPVNTDFTDGLVHVLVAPLGAMTPEPQMQCRNCRYYIDSRCVAEIPKKLLPLGLGVQQLDMPPDTQGCPGWTPIRER